MREKSDLLILAVVIAFLAMTATATAQPYICGDTDGDGIVNISDAVYLITYIFGGGPEPLPLLAGDADGNQIVNVSDAVYLIAYIFGGGPAPTCPCSTVTDIDGNVYQAIEIGDQCWMAENLKVTHYRNGEPIPHVVDAGTWDTLSTAAYCDYENDPANVNTYGRLYNWHVVEDSGHIAPAGWHVPTDEEWKQLEMHLGMSQAEADAEAWRGINEGGKLKEAGTMHWDPPNEGATNESGFTALPGGYRSLDGGFTGIVTYARFWSATETSADKSWNRSLSYDQPTVYRGRVGKQVGLSVRCIKD